MEDAVNFSALDSFPQMTFNRALDQLFREKLDRLVLEAFCARKGRSGAFGLRLDLDELGHTYDRKTVAASMKRQGLRAKAAKKFKAAADSDHNLPVAPNLRVLRSDFFFLNPQFDITS